VRETIEQTLVCTHTVSNVETLLKPLWENFIRSANHQDIYGCIQSVNSDRGVIVEDIRKMTSQYQTLTRVIQYRGPSGVSTKTGYAGPRGGVDTTDEGVVEKFSKEREMPSGETGVQDEDLGGVLKVHVLVHGHVRVGS
jgi:hypothetical protein